MTTEFAPLPISTRNLLTHNTHPGLMLDKYARSWTAQGPPGKLSGSVQLQTVHEVVRLTDFSIRTNAELYRHLRDRQVSIVCQRSRFIRFACRTTGPMTLHLARASALENAGICLHPIYGFVYLPGSGLKGMARAYAETVADACVEDLLDVFGSATGERSQEKQRAGGVVFDDAWPTEWPKLITDIVNNHHPKYYLDGRDGPGDWESPNPVYFLAVPRDVTFEFILSARRDDVPENALQMAREWLLGALCHFGAGAKTGAGYGSFLPVPITDVTAASIPALPDTKVKQVETRLTLISPAFLAGANQRSEDCDLRSATLRGLLRWWWRTLHSGFLDITQLRSLENEIWGNTEQSGLVRIDLVRAHDVKPALFTKSHRPSMLPQEKVGPYGIPDELLDQRSSHSPQKTTQGLYYASYGMAERERERMMLDAGATWKLRLVVRERKKKGGLPSEEALNQAKAALWLLCRFGGVGSKAGKGFGSLQLDDMEIESLEECQRLAADLRKNCGHSSPFHPALAQSPSMEQRLEVLEVDFPWPDVWSVLDQVGFAYQAFAKQYAHQREKWALGLPRRIGRGPADVSGNFSPTGPMARLMGPGPKPQNNPNIRHPSPLRFHIDKCSQGFRVRLLILPATFLPDLVASQRFLGECRQFLMQDLQRRAQLAPFEPTRTQSPRGGGGDVGRARSRGQQSQNRQSPNSSVDVPETNNERIKAALEKLSDGQAILKISEASAPGEYLCQLLKAAPKIPAGYQLDGSRRSMLIGAPQSLPVGTFVVVQWKDDRGQFVQILGRFPDRGDPRGKVPRRR